MKYDIRTILAKASHILFIAVHPLIGWLDQQIRKVAEEKRRKQNEKLVRRFQSCGQGIRLNGSILVTEPESVSIGNNVHIGDNAFFSTSGGLTIGDNTHISRNVTIYTVNHRYEGTALPYDNEEIPNPVLIGRNVWIGMNVNIVPGTRIGDGAIIGMGSVVASDTPPLSIVGGAPAQLLKKRDDSRYVRLEAERSYGGINGTPLDPAAVSAYLPGPDAIANRIFFVVDPVSPGGLAFANSLSCEESITCLYEPRRQLIRISTELAHSWKSRTEVLEELRAIYANSSVYPTGIYGEVDPNFWNLLPLLNEIFPQSRFIWLLRDGRDVVDFIYQSGWFSDDERSKATHRTIAGRKILYRLDGALCGAYSEAEWAALSQFERCCWYWGYITQQVSAELERIPKERRRTAGLGTVHDHLDELFVFLGIRTSTRSCATREKSNSRSPLKPPENSTSHAWSANQQDIFDHHCGTTMDRFYQNWRTK